MKKLTPMMKQYIEIKAQYEDCIVFYRLGDFYEMFFDDAKVASEILKITLTSRSKDASQKIPMCGIPYHSAHRYIEKLLDRGKKIAICEQVSDPKEGKGIVERKVVKVITPSLSLQSESSQSHHYLAAITTQKKQGLNTFVLSYLDLATGAFKVTKLSSEQALRDELSRVSPKELLWPSRLKDQGVLKTLKKIYPDLLINLLNDKAFSHSNLMAEKLLKTVDVESQAAVSAILFYLEMSQYKNYAHIQKIDPYQIDQTVHLDASAIRNLELVETAYDRHYEGSLLWLLDRTSTFMGKRLLRQWLLYPQLNLKEIKTRQQAISELVASPTGLEKLETHLKEISDLERILSRLTFASANARDLVSLKDALLAIPNINSDLAAFHSFYLSRKLQVFEPLSSLLHRALSVEPPLTLKEGEIIKVGFNSELDELIRLMTDGKKFIAQLESKERQQTGISSLKIRFNNVFGYYIEVTKTHLKSVPENYIRKQTLVNAERYITPELKEYENKILNAQDKRKRLEYELFETLRDNVLSQMKMLLALAGDLSHIDVLCSLSRIALDHHYVCPVVTAEQDIILSASRHPVIEKTSQERFVPNDIKLSKNNFVSIITGPNMAGKSTVMRQVALISLMAQMGSFVPASKAQLGLVDGIFTRVGAHDNLSAGESTFMVEMKETAQILKRATSKSLIILDEIGRGTSTFDGLSIAWAVASDIHDRIGAKTLFATHYHELTALAAQKAGMENFHIAIKQIKGEIVFLRKLLAGSIERSYGVEVARLAGLPTAVVEQARKVLYQLEKTQMGGKLTAGRQSVTPSNRPSKGSRDQIGLFSSV